MTIWPAASLLLALAASPAWAEAGPTAESPAAAQHDTSQGQQPRRTGDRNRSGNCANCGNPAARAPMTEAPNRALMMIPAAHVVPTWRGLPDWGDTTTQRSPTLLVAAYRPPVPRY